MSRFNKLKATHTHIQPHTRRRRHEAARHVGRRHPRSWCTDSPLKAHRISHASRVPRTSSRHALHRRHVYMSVCMHTCRPRLAARRGRQDWVLWDSGTSVGAYCRKMAQGGVCGAAASSSPPSRTSSRSARARPTTAALPADGAARLVPCAGQVNVFVYQSAPGGFKRISSFEAPRMHSHATVRAHTRT